MQHLSFDDPRAAYAFIGQEFFPIVWAGRSGVVVQVDYSQIDLPKVASKRALRISLGDLVSVNDQRLTVLTDGGTHGVFLVQVPADLISYCVDEDTGAAVLSMLADCEHADHLLG